MVRVSLSLVLLAFLATACAAARQAPVPQAERPDREGLPQLSLCAPEQARSWARGQGLAPRLRAAGCFARLAETARSEEQGLAWAEQGQKLALTAAEQAPDNATAQYLAAYLTGLRAEREPMRGLSLVPVIAKHARAAAKLDPALDRAGPRRILGELLLQAPGFPVSIGDPSAAVEQFRKAVQLAPDFPENRIGLAESLLETGREAEACRTLAPVLEQAKPANIDPAAWSRAVRVLQNVCAEIPSAANQ
jgi:hypothetical protein